MAQDRWKLSALAALLPAGTLGLSVTLAAASAKATQATDAEARKPGSIAGRLQTIREDVAGAMDEHRFLKVDPDKRMAWWGNGWHGGWGWHNGGWGNGGWRNGGWGHGGWGNGWHNGGWGNWHNW